jgi:membrane associated rhomboid family serine protease
LTDPNAGECSAASADRPRNDFMNPTEEAPAATQEDWVRVGHYPSLSDAYDHGLVILAMGESCRVEEAAAPGGFDLQAEALPAGKISAELDAYTAETAMAPAVRAPLPERPAYSAGWWLTGLWVLALLTVYRWQGEDPGLVERAASSSVGLIGNGEWWRPFTALFLHGDVSHIAGNLVGGTIFGTLVARSAGALRGWLMILLCGAAGNAITSVVMFPEPYSSIGASSAVFAALGILSGMGIAETFRDRARLPWLRISAPVLAGVVLLGWLGSGNGPGTDVMGHVFGFGSGVVAGTAMGALERPPEPPSA